MGFKPDRDLRYAPTGPDDPQNAGAMAGQFSGTATLMVRSGDGWEYGDEIDIDIVPNACYELPFTASRRLYWSGIEVTVAIAGLRANSGDPDKRGMTPCFVVAALVPAELGWSACARLRAEDHHLRKKERNEEIRKWVERKQELTWDPFLRARGKCVARLNDPLRLHYQGGRNLDNGFVVGTEPAGVTQAVWHFGICPDACLEELGLYRSQAATDALPHGGLVRAPRRHFADVAQAAAWYACAGRAEGETITFERMQAQAEKALPALSSERMA